MTAYEVRIGDWSSDVCSSDLLKLGVDLCCGCWLQRRYNATILNHGAGIGVDADEVGGGHDGGGGGGGEMLVEHGGFPVVDDVRVCYCQVRAKHAGDCNPLILKDFSPERWIACQRLLKIAPTYGELDHFLAQWRNGTARYARSHPRPGR